MIEKLKDFDPTETIRTYKNKPEWKGKNPTEILHTFPSYRCFPKESPKQRFEKWTWYTKANAICQQLSKINSQSDFDHFAFRLGRSLVSDWATKNDKVHDSRMTFGVAMKVVNLTFKHLTYMGGIRNQQLVHFLHVPWDKYTLRPLQSVFNKSGPDYTMPATASMGFVNTPDIYDLLHKVISGICTEAGVPRIYYEFYAWDHSHEA